MTEMNAPQRTAKEQFDRQAEHYNAQWSQWTEESLAWLLAHAHCRPTDTALDVATGTGFTALGFAPHVGWVTGLDVSSGNAGSGTTACGGAGNHERHLRRGRGPKHYPSPMQASTLVTCRIAPHHFLSVPQFLQETRRVLRRGGRLALADTAVPG